MSSALAPMARSGPQRWSRLWKAAAAASLLSCGSASAQTANDARVPQNPRIQSAYAEWRKLSQHEVDCVDQTLRARRSSLWLVIQQGVSPSNATVATIRAACRAQARAPNPSRVAQSGSHALASSVESRTEDAADKAAADKAAADKAAADKAAADKAAADKAAAEKAAAEKAAAEKAAAEKAAAGKAAADKAAADKAAAGKAAAGKAVAETVAAGKATKVSAKAGADPASVDPIKAKADAAYAPQEAATATAEAARASAAAEPGMSFVYGLISGPLIFSFGGVVFLLLSRKRTVAVAPPQAVAPDNTGRADRSDFDRLVTAVLTEQQRRDSKQHPPAAPEREQRIDEAALH